MHPPKDADLRDEGAQRRLLERILQRAPLTASADSVGEAAGPRLGEQTIQGFGLRDLRRELFSEDDDPLAALEVRASHGSFSSTINPLR